MWAGNSRGKIPGAISKNIICKQTNIALKVELSLANQMSAISQVLEPLGEQCEVGVEPCCLLTFDYEILEAVSESNLVQWLLDIIIVICSGRTLVRSTDVRSTCMYGQFMAGPKYPISKAI